MRFFLAEVSLLTSPHLVLILVVKWGVLHFQSWHIIPIFCKGLVLDWCVELPVEIPSSRTEICRIYYMLVTNLACGCNCSYDEIMIVIICSRWLHKIWPLYVQILCCISVVACPQIHQAHSCFCYWPVAPQSLSKEEAWVLVVLESFLYTQIVCY